MQMGFRWYGEGNNIKIFDIKRIPGVTSIVGAMRRKMPGEIWEEAEIAEASHRDCGGPGTVRPGYCLYDHALGIMYMLGCRDMLERLEGKV